jgi:NAD(P)-dependent dehydrogenase (short-subunit alcohol dehydrogenase family)
MDGAMTIGLDNVLAVVTGANGGIGRATVAAMRAAGAAVIAADLQPEAAGEGFDHYLPLDVTLPEDWDRLRGFVESEYGRLDALVHNAGLSIVGKFEDTPLAEFHRVNAVNVDSVILGTQALLPLLIAGGKARKGGASVVNLSSVGGLRGAPFNAAYCTSKAAVAMLSKCMGAEFAALGHNIRVNSLHPGGIDTGMLAGIFQAYVDLGVMPDVETAIAGTAARHPIGRMGRPDEIASGVVFLCSDAASFMTADQLVIDGGFASV